jgi:hypothetical protein
MPAGGWVDIPTAAVGAGEWRQLMEDCLDDLASCGEHGMSRGDVAVFLRHWWDQVGS